VIGCALAGAAWWSWRTQSEVDRLKLQVCDYQYQVVLLLGDLSAYGYHIHSTQVPRPRTCH